MWTADRAGRRRIPERPNERPVLMLPGSGSDEVFVTAAFARPLAAVGLRLVAPRPRPGTAVVAGYLAELDAALDGVTRPEQAPLVGGVSLGAQVAARWAGERARTGRPTPAGLLLALPAWTGPPGSAPAAVAARLTADAVRRDGLPATVARTVAETPPWLGAELARSWARHGPGLADALATAAGTAGPAAEDLAALDLPVGLAGLRDDPVHPLAEARAWRDRLPRAALVCGTLAAAGRDPEALGRAAVLAWLRALSGT